MIDHLTKHCLQCTDIVTLYLNSPLVRTETFLFHVSSVITDLLLSKHQYWQLFDHFQSSNMVKLVVEHHIVCAGLQFSAWKRELSLFPTRSHVLQTISNHVFVHSTSKTHWDKLTPSISHPLSDSNACPPSFNVAAGNSWLQCTVVSADEFDNMSHSYILLWQKSQIHSEVAIDWVVDTKLLRAGSCFT